MVCVVDEIQGLGIVCPGIMFMMHGIEHQHVSADDQQQCPDQRFHEIANVCEGAILGTIETSVKRRSSLRSFTVPPIAGKVARVPVPAE